MCEKQVDEYGGKFGGLAADGFDGFMALYRFGLLFVTCFYVTQCACSILLIDMSMSFSMARSFIVAMPVLKNSTSSLTARRPTEHVAGRGVGHHCDFRLRLDNMI